MASFNALGVCFGMALGSFRSEHVCPDDDFKWICDIERGSEHQTYLLGAALYKIDRQYQLPRGTQLRGRGTRHTFIHAVGTPSTSGCGSFARTRIGLVAGSDSYIGGFTFRGIDVQRYVDGPSGLCGGGAIETPGCADADCDEPYDTGSTNGTAVSNVLIENVDIATKDGKPTVQVNFWMPRTRRGQSNNVTVRNMNSNGSWADGLNVHGAHTNIVVENCNLGNSGDDVFAMWSAGPAMANVTFRNNTAFNPTYPWNATPIPSWGANHVNCFAAYGGSGRLVWTDNRGTPAPVGLLPDSSPQPWNDTGVVVFHTSFGSAFDAGATATIRGNSFSSHTADGAEVRPDFPVCNWAGHTERGTPLIVGPHDAGCANVRDAEVVVDV